MTETELRQLIERVAARFERPVDPAAIDALYEPARPHLNDVTRALANREITIDFLESSVMKILTNARPIMLNESISRVDARVVRMSMSKECPYSFWC